MFFLLLIILLLLIPMNNFSPSEQCLFYSIVLIYSCIITVTRSSCVTCRTVLLLLSRCTYSVILCASYSMCILFSLSRFPPELSTPVWLGPCICKLGRVCPRRGCCFSFYCQCSCCYFYDAHQPVAGDVKVTTAVVGCRRATEAVK